MLQLSRQAERTLQPCECRTHLVGAKAVPAQVTNALFSIAPPTQLEIRPAPDAGVLAELRTDKSLPTQSLPVALVQAQSLPEVWRQNDVLQRDHHGWLSISLIAR
jgi:hypothetical protein